MKLIIFLYFLILLSVPELCKCQETSSNEVGWNVTIKEKTLDSNYNAVINYDTVGMALIKCEQIKEDNTHKDNLIENLRTQIKEWIKKDSNKEITIQKLITELSKQPTFISSHDWKITILISGLTAILTIITTLQLTK